MTKKFKKPPRPVCSLCGYDDFVREQSLGEGAWQYTCTGPHHEEPRVWEAVAESGLTDLELTGLTQEWGLYDDLPKCLSVGEPLVEYGVVEHRYLVRNPARYRFLLDRYGHTAIAPANYTTSSFIAAALGRMLKHGDVAGDWGPATGRWAYNGTVSYWGLPGVDKNAPMLSWVEYAEAQGLDPGTWPLP